MLYITLSNTIRNKLLQPKIIYYLCFITLYFVFFLLLTGPICDEVHETYSDWVSQIIRVYKDEPFIEFNWLVGPIPLGLVHIFLFFVTIK